MGAQLTPGMSSKGGVGERSEILQGLELRALSGNLSAWLPDLFLRMEIYQAGTIDQGAGLI